MGNKFGLKVLEIKTLVIIAILIFVVTISIGTTSALDVGDPDISAKILAPNELMPNSTYFLGIKYMVNATFWGADPAIDPEIIFNVENGEIIEKLSGRFKAVNTSQSCTFSLDGEIAEKRNETVVVIIKTGSSGSVNIDLTARAHDSDNYNHIITTTNPISIPIKKLNPNSVEYFKELAEQRKTLFEQYLYLVNETLMGTTSEVEKMNDEAMQTALLKTTSACYKMALGEFIGSGAGSFLDPITGIAGTYEYMDFTNEAINGFEGNPLFAAVGWIFNWCDYVINKMVLDMDIRILFGHGFTGPDYYLNQYSSLIDEETACWDNNDFNGLKDVLEEEKGFWSYKDAYLRVSSGINDYENLPEDTRTYVKLLYKSVGNSIDADCRLVHEYVEPAIKEPKPRFISVPNNKIDLGKGDEYELVFKIKNDGGTASDSYFSLSISDGLDITDNSSDKPNGVFSIYHRGILIWYQDEYQIPASYTLLDWYRPWLSAGEEQTIKVKIKGEERGEQWVKYRLAFKSKLEGLSFVRSPLSGELDQQGWYAYKINVNVSDITNQEPNADFSYLVDGLSVGFTSLSRDPDEDALDYYWDFDDGSSSTEENPTHEYENGGDYSVTLTVADTKGLSDYKTRDIHVNKKPTADFVYSVNGTDVTFVSTSMDDGSIVSWEWDFEDGKTGSGEVVSHSYSLVGSYEVNLTVTDDDGVTDSTTKGITVSEVPNVIYVPDGYARIQWAVDNASAGDTIIVRDGTYYENVVVNKHLTLKSENGSAYTTINGGGSGHVVRITADNVRIEGFTVTGSGWYEYDNGLEITSSNNIITYNSISNNNAHGIYLYSSSNNNIISSNNISNNEEGIALYSSSNNNIISSNNIYSNNYDGIYLDSSSNNSITSNNISNNYDGIVLNPSSNNSIVLQQHHKL